MKVSAPGKLILSGEHAVVYGHPALAMAVNRYVRATITEERGQEFLFHLADLSHHSHLNIQALRHLKKRIKSKYHRFIRGEYRVQDVLQKPFELAQFALSMLIESLNPSSSQSMKIHLQSDIPIGCGMGSSAATILSIICAVSNYLQLPLSKELLFKLALEAENMQHGHSSGLDLRVILQGGCLYVEGDKVETRCIPHLSMHLINTGTPQTSTGECVNEVAKYFASSKELGNDFRAVTNMMDDALQKSSLYHFKEAVCLNHKLLVKIGVVPDKVQRFISAVEALKGCAKVCGAGAIGGDTAGILLVIAEDDLSLTSLCKQFNYDLIPILSEQRGITCCA
jgi:mevalonate kinase